MLTILIKDIFQKFRANGFNAVSIYFFWSYHSAAKGVYDFETSGKNLQRLFGYAKEAGLYIIARPGPYSNAETNGGGLALWGSDGSLGLLRTSNGTYFEAWQSWVANIGKILAENQITNGGVCLHTHNIVSNLSLSEVLTLPCSPSSLIRSRMSYKKRPIYQIILLFCTWSRLKKPSATLI